MTGPCIRSRRRYRVARRLRCRRSARAGGGRRGVQEARRGVLAGFSKADAKCDAALHTKDAFLMSVSGEPAAVGRRRSSRLWRRAHRPYKEARYDQSGVYQLWTTPTLHRRGH